MIRHGRCNTKFTGSRWKLERHSFRKFSKMSVLDWIKHRSYLLTCLSFRNHWFSPARASLAIFPMVSLTVLFPIIFLTHFFHFHLSFLSRLFLAFLLVLLLNSLVVCKVSWFRSFRLLSTSLLIMLTRFGVSFYCGCLGYFTLCVPVVPPYTTLVFLPTSIRIQAIIFEIKFKKFNYILTPKTNP